MTSLFLDVLFHEAVLLEALASCSARSEMISTEDISALPVGRALSLRQGSKPKAETATAGSVHESQAKRWKRWRAPIQDNSWWTRSWSSGSPRQADHSKSACRTVIVKMPWSAKRSNNNDRSSSLRATEISASTRTS